VPTLPLSLPGRRGDHEDDDTPGPSADAAREDPQFDRLAPPAANVTVIPPETDDVPQVIRPGMRRLRLRPRRPAEADPTP
jgi:hypothetical protein